MTAPGALALAVALEEALRQMPAAVIVAEASSRTILYSNALAQQMAQRWLGRPLPPGLEPDWEIFHPDGRPYRMDEWPLVRSITSGEEVVDEEYFHVLPDGGRMIVRCRSSPIHDEDGRTIAGVLVLDDITERRRVEDQLRHHGRLLEEVEDAVVGTDPEFRLTIWNRGAERLYGYTAAEVLGRDAREVATYAGDTSRREVEGELLQSDRSRSEFVAHRKDGTAVDVELIAVALRDHQGEISGYLGIHRDVTERKRAERTLREARSQIQTILESISDAFVAWDREWRYTYVNDRALRRLEEWRGRPVSRDELLGNCVWEVFPDTIGTETERQLRTAMSARQPVEFELYFAATGEWIEAHGYPSQTGLSLYYRNISARKRATEDRERSARRQAAVAELGVRALASNDVQALMDEACSVTAQMLATTPVGIAELTPGGDALLLRAGRGWRAGAVGVASAPLGERLLLSYTVKAGEPVISDDLASDDRFTMSALLRAERPVSGVSVAIAGRTQAFGALAAFSRDARSFSADDANFLQSVANVLAAAVERAEAEQTLIDVKEAERRRIARGLHDEALQDVTDVLALARTRQRGSADAEDALAQLIPALQRVGSHLRGAVFDLRLDAEQDRAFAELLRALVESHRAMAAGCDIRLDIGEGVPAGPLGRRGTEILRIAGEAIANARRHAAACEIRVVAWRSAGLLGVEVTDDGRGFDVTGLPGGGAGVRGMRERAALLGAELEISSEPASGTHVRLEVPFAPEADAGDHEVRVLLVEDHTAVRQALAAMLDRERDLTVVGQAPSLAGARTMLHGVDVAVIDLGLPDGWGGDLVEELREASPDAQALVLSATLDRADVARAVESGAAAALDKTAHLDEVVDAVRRVRAGETLMPPAEVRDLLRLAAHRREEERDDRRAIETLTAREREVLRALGEGVDTQTIAERLQISPRTVRNHVASTLTKLGVHSQLQAVLFALRYGLVDVG